MPFSLSKPGLDSSTGWCGSVDTKDFLQMITVSEGIERIKGVVTQGRKDVNQWVKLLKFTSAVMVILETS